MALLWAYLLMSILLAFRGVRWQLFLAAVVTVPVLSTLLGLTVMLLHNHIGKEAIFHALLVLFFLVTVLVIRGVVRPVYSRLAGVSVVLLTVVLTGSIVLCTGYLDIAFDIFDRNQYDLLDEALDAKHAAGWIDDAQFELKSNRINALETTLREHIDDVYITTGIASILLYLLVWLPLLQWIFNRLNSYPRKQ